MGKLSEKWVLLATFGMIGMYANCTDANASKGTDDLYSENIYIHKSSAEIPQSLDSNATPQADRNLKNSAKKDVDSISDEESGPSGEKITRR